METNYPRDSILKEISSTNIFRAAPSVSYRLLTSGLTVFAVGNFGTLVLEFAKFDRGSAALLDHLATILIYVGVYLLLFGFLVLIFSLGGMVVIGAAKSLIKTMSFRLGGNFRCEPLSPATIQEP